jgi:hypothetical protein
MHSSSKPHKISKPFGLLLGAVLILFLSVSTAFAHGPKGHGGVEFTAMQAAKKGIELFDRLIVSGKLEEDWETGLQEIEMSERSTGKGKELVVKFTRVKNLPRSVYIFFTEKGDYNGSNFTGD